MSYADKKGIPYVILVGEDEIRTETFTLKNMATGEQQTVSFTELLEQIS